MVDVESPRLGPSSLPPMVNGGIRSNYSPVPTSNAYAPTPHTIPTRSLLQHLDHPISPKTIPATSHYISPPVEPTKAVTTDGMHRATQAAYQTSPTKSKREERSDISQNERQHFPSMASGRTSVSSRKGILKTSSTYVARNPSQSLPHLPSDGTLASTNTREGINDASRSSVSASPVRGSITSQLTSSGEASVSRYSEERRNSGERKLAAQGFHSRLSDEFYASMRPGPPLSPESHIVNLGPDPKLICDGSPGALARRVTISLPSRSSIRSHRVSAADSDEELEALQRQNYRPQCRESR